MKKTKLSIGKKKNKGFTLIELLVVISIIGLLASVLLVALNGARSKARDAKRIADLHQLSIAMEEYINDHGTGISGNWPGWWAQLTNSCAGWTVPSSNLVPSYMAKVPDDPLSTGPWPNCSAADGYWYYYGQGIVLSASNTLVSIANDNTDWVICTKLENPSNVNYKVIANPWNASWVLNYCVGE